MVNIINENSLKKKKILIIFTDFQRKIHGEMPQDTATIPHFNKIKINDDNIMIDDSNNSREKLAEK